MSACVRSNPPREDAMAIEKLIRTQDAEENTISGRYSIKKAPSSFRPLMAVD